MAKDIDMRLQRKRGTAGKTVSSAGGCFTGFICDCSFAGIFLQGQYGYIVGGISLCAMLLSVYGFAMGLKAFQKKPDTQSRYDRLYCKRNHNDRMAGNLSDGNFRLINREV